MPGSFLPEDKTWLKSMYKQGRYYPEEIAILESAFDEQTNYDIDMIQKKMDQTSYLKKLSFIKLLLFLPEYVLFRLLLGKRKASLHKDVAKCYWQFIRGTISLEVFQSKLKTSMS